MTDPLVRRRATVATVLALLGGVGDERQQLLDTRATAVAAS
jgi:hypothetical protein